jgi:preprotein translocase subunit YajC
MDLLYELMWRGGPLVIMTLALFALIYFSMAQERRRHRRARRNAQPGE